MLAMEVKAGGTKSGQIQHCLGPGWIKIMMMTTFAQAPKIRV